jgi:type II secretion system protein H
MLTPSVIVNTSQRAAFTLLELVLVLALIGILAGISVHYLSPLRHGQAVEQAARQLLDDIQRCQDLSVQHTELIRLRINLDERDAAIAMTGAGSDQQDAFAADHSLSSQDLSIRFFNLDGSEQDAGSVDLLFLPDQRCENAGIFVLSMNQYSIQVECFSNARPPQLRRLL